MSALIACGPIRDTTDAGTDLADSGHTPDAASEDGGSCPDAGVPRLHVQCDAGTDCLAIPISGDAPATLAGSFKGFADPALSRDPDVSNRVWLTYSWPHGKLGTGVDGGTVAMGAVSTRLARSDNGGASFSYVGELWSATPMPDPEGSGETGLINSETASMVAMTSDGGASTWYAARLAYFQRPFTGYHPKYATGWTVRVAAAASPAQLATAPDTTLGVSGTSSAYSPAARLNVLAGLPITRCAMLNNPTLFAQRGQLYLIVECLAFVGTTPAPSSNSTQVFGTTPSGLPSSWTWRYVGTLADNTLARALADETVQQPDVSVAADGTLLLLVTPAHTDPSRQVGTKPAGCAAIELDSIDPPVLRRDCGGRPVVRARIDAAGGSCTHVAGSATGIVITSESEPRGGNWNIHATRLIP